MVLALGFAYTPRFARIVRGSVLSLKEKEFIEASLAMGNSDLTIIFRHILPNSLAPLIVMATALPGLCHFGRIGLEFPGPGRAASGAVLGQYLERCAEFYVGQPRYDGLSGHSH